MPTATLAAGPRAAVAARPDAGRAPTRVVTVPVLTHGLAWLGLGDGPALIVLANEAAFAATVMLYVLVRRGDSWWLAAGQNTPIRLAQAPAATGPRA